MAASEDLIDFDVIEGQKENIQALPGGRSAKKLAQLYSPSPLHKLSTPTPIDTKNVNDIVRAEFEAEVANLSESDDPLDIFDRYVRWTFDAYPSAQATPSSQLHTLLERATKSFIGNAQYRNDPRYLRLWLHYIHLFSDAPRETFVFLARHAIGDSLALFYEEYAAWLEGAGRWRQADEVYRLGLEREARPAQRLVRKFAEFEQRRAQREREQADDPNDSPSPALPVVRPALAAKIDPFAAATADPQAPRPNMGLGGQSGSTTTAKSGKAGKSKLAIFSDADSAGAAPAMASSSMGGGGGGGPKGWDTIGSLAERKKENTVAPKPWVGETLKTGGAGKKSGGGGGSAPKMAVFRDPSLARIAQSHIIIAPSKHQVITNPSNGKRERIFVNLEAVYPTPEEPGTELSFEELWAASRGWLDVCWDDDEVQEDGHDGVYDENRREKEPLGGGGGEGVGPSEVDLLTQKVATKLVVHHDVVRLDENGAIMKDQPKSGSKPRKKKVMEVNETQIIKAKLDSPSGRKIRKKNSSEPTMTIHTKAATDEIYDLFNAPLPTQHEEQDGDSDEDEYMTDGDYTSGGESTCTTTRLIGHDDEDDETSDVKSISEWSDFTARKHIPDIDDGEGEGENDTRVSDLIDTNDEDPDSPSSAATATRDVMHDRMEDDDMMMDEEQDEPRTRTIFIPIPPEDYVAPTRPYRDAAEVANNRLPFMTPITERTETSLGVVTAGKQPKYYDVKTPISSRKDSRDTPMEDVDDDEETTSNAEDEDDEDYEPMSSPLRDVPSEEEMSPVQVPAVTAVSQPAIVLQSSILLQKAMAKAVPAARRHIPKGPIIKDEQCNPVDESVRDEILAKMHPPLSSYKGFYDHRHERCDRGSEIRRFAKVVSKGGKNNGDRSSIGSSPVVLEFPEIGHAYVVKRELGAGAFAPVYLVENSSPRSEGKEEQEEEALIDMGKDVFKNGSSSSLIPPHHRRSSLEALKMEQPPTAWEFHMMRLAASRLGPHDRAMASITPAHELHLYQDEAFLFLPLHPHGSLLDVVNYFREQPGVNVMDEPLAMLFTIDLLRTVEALHRNDILHGDLKVDNCLLRLPLNGDQQQLSSQWRRDGSGGWAERGIVLIDFGRAIDMRAFVDDVHFIADWKTDMQDCAEIREGRPWTWQIDYHGVAAIVHTLLFGKYMETCTSSSRHSSGGGGGLGNVTGKKYRIREGLKRYWQTDIWGSLFDLLLNPGSHVEGEEGRRMPVMRGLRGVRTRMEEWLEGNCERGVGIKALMGRVEGEVRRRKRV